MLISGAHHEKVKKPICRCSSTFVSLEQFFDWTFFSKVDIVDQETLWSIIHLTFYLYHFLLFLFVFSLFRFIWCDVCGKPLLDITNIRMKKLFGCRWFSFVFLCTHHLSFHSCRCNKNYCAEQFQQESRFKKEKKTVDRLKMNIEKWKWI